MVEPDGCGRLVISNMVLSRMSSRLATITSISSSTDFSLRKEIMCSGNCGLKYILISLYWKRGKSTFPNIESKSQRTRELDRPGPPLTHLSEWPLFIDNKGHGDVNSLSKSMQLHCAVGTSKMMGWCSGKHPRLIQNSSYVTNMVCIPVQVSLPFWARFFTKRPSWF